MKHLKRFESFSDSTDRKELLESTGLLDILFDLKDVSLEYLDEPYVQDSRFASEEDEDITALDKTLIFNVDLLEGKKIRSEYGGHIGHLLGGNYSLEENELEKNLHWSDEITESIEEIKKGLESGNMSFSITFVIVVGEYGDAKISNEDTSGALRRISEMYPEVEFDTINPWDLN